VPKSKDKENQPGEHIFPASQLTPLGVKWKELTGSGRHREAMEVLEQIIKGSTPMFERLAMHENFHHTVDLQALVSAAQEKIVRWLLAWEPKKGRLFTFFSKCAKHAFLSEVGKITQYRKRFYSTSDSLEEIHGSEDHQVNKHDLALEVRQKIEELHTRWGDPQEIGALRFILECIVMDDTHDKQATIWSAAYAYGISPEVSKFFYTWAFTALRHQMLYKIHIPFTEQDLLRAAESYTFLPDLMDLIGYENVMLMITVHPGQRFKLPTLSALKKLHDDYRLYREIDASDMDPESIAAIARKHKKTEKGAQETYAEMTAKLDANRYGEHSIYDNDVP
jgi:hypothetical protein